MSYSMEKAYLAQLVYDNLRVNQSAVDNVARYQGPNGAIWEIMAFRDSPNGYQGAVFKNVNTGEVVLVNRGTEIGLDN